MTADTDAAMRPSIDESAPVPSWAVQLRVDVAVIVASMTALNDHETRIRSLERKAYTLAGFASIAGAGLGQLLDLLKGTP